MGGQKGGCEGDGLEEGEEKASRREGEWAKGRQAGDGGRCGWVGTREVNRGRALLTADSKHQIVSLINISVYLYKVGNRILI